MEQEPLISVIVPAYNAEAFLDQCIKSIVAQSYRHLEIIIVDDGSTDGTGTLCDRWAQRDGRIRVIHQTNGGHSAARNAALDAMNGQLLTMVDSDDVLHPEFITTLLDVMRQTGAEIAVGGYIPFYGDAPAFPPASTTGSIKCFSQQEAILAVLYQQGLTHSPWGRLFKASLFDGIRFPLGIIYEDLAIIYPLLRHCTTVASIAQPLYGYRQHQSNSMRVFSPRRTAVLDVCEQLEQQMQNEDPQYLKAARSRLLSAYFNILLLSQQDHSQDYSQLQNRCWAGIKRLRCQCLLDSQVRRKNKIGILASLLGRGFLCSVAGRNYQPKP
ncbi:MAG: glycosyltransferase family 2 protein [Muribaculaceae bacterium]|nr:glycosyltransferase family 2 protein [Muribaculaceae bacterium]